MTLLSHLRNISYYSAILLQKKKKEQNITKTPDLPANWDEKYIKRPLITQSHYGISKDYHSIIPCDGGISLVLFNNQNNFRQYTL